MKKFLLFFLVLIISLFIFTFHQFSNNTELYLKYKEYVPYKKRILLRSIGVKANSLFSKQKKEYIFTKREKIFLNKGNFNKKLTLYNNPSLNFLGPRAYFASDDKNLFLITGTGVLLVNKIDNLDTNKESFKFLTINTNIENYLAEYKKDSDVFFTSTVKGILIREDKIFISIIQKFKNKYNYKTNKSEECYKHAILKGDLNTNNINLDNFFTVDDCRVSYNDYVGGTLADFKDEKILYTVGDFSVREDLAYTKPNDTKYCEENNAQIMESALGKIFEIDINNGNADIISLGHDNPQGLYYDKTDDVIISTEHGPQGGDEININRFPSKNNLKNYGYPISSYGEHYGSPDPSALYKYKNAPLHKSHKKYGFEEPLDFFTPSIGISKVVLFKDQLLIGSMGNDIDEGDLSLHVYDINKKFEISNHNVFTLNQRVRDIYIVNKNNKVLLFLESNSSIGILE